jgi:hypothetical protein
MQGQQIGIAGEDRVSLAVQSGFEKLVVFGITALADLVHHWHRQHRLPPLHRTQGWGTLRFGSSKKEEPDGANYLSADSRQLHRS